jgi:hypothetical protein
MRLFLTCVSSSLVVILLTFGLPWSYGANNTAVNATVNPQDERLQKLLDEYWNWWVNLPVEQSPEADSAVQCTLDKSGSDILLLNSFQMGKIVQTCDIPSSSSVLFPFYIGMCDNGNKGYYNEQSFERIVDCALDSDRGVVTMKAILDNETIIDMEVDNRDVHNPKIIKNNLPQSMYYSKPTSHSFFNLTVTNKTQYDIYEKPEDFQSVPYTYKAAADCFCGLVPNHDLPPGPHQLTYITSVKGSEGADDPKGWNYDSDITYHLNVSK